MTPPWNNIYLGQFFDDGTGIAQHFVPVEINVCTLIIFMYLVILIVTVTAV